MYIKRIGSLECLFWIWKELGRFVPFVVTLLEDEEDIVSKLLVRIYETETLMSRISFYFIERIIQRNIYTFTHYRRLRFWVFIVYLYNCVTFYMPQQKMKHTHIHIIPMNDRFLEALVLFCLNIQPTLNVTFL